MERNEENASGIWMAVGMASGIWMAVGMAT